VIDVWLKKCVLRDRHQINHFENGNKVLECEDKINKKRKIVGNNQLTITNYHNSTKIPDAKVTKINCALAKFFIACGILF
jgi:hypothetical protein